MKRCTGLYGKWIKYTFFRSKMEQNIEFPVPGSAKYRRFRSNILRQNIEASGAESSWAYSRGRVARILIRRIWIQIRPINHCRSSGSDGSGSDQTITALVFTKNQGHNFRQHSQKALEIVRTSPNYRSSLIITSPVST